MRVLILANNDIGLYNFRRELIEALLWKGYDVHISSPNGKRIDDLIRLGINYHESQLERHGINLFQELRLLINYKKLISRVEPAVILGYTIKPNIYGAIVARKRHIPFIANITGLGTALESGGWKQKMFVLLYKHAFKEVQTVFFQNTENQRFFEEQGIVVHRHQLLPGSGVNLERNRYEEYPPDDGTVTFLFIGRLMKDKGIEELITAAKQICEKHSNVLFFAAGSCEPDYQEQLEDLGVEGYIHLLGQLTDVHEWIRKSNAVILPSYHEGMSNALLEAAASGRPVLASNIPGCRETFDEGISGIGFEPRNAESLCKAIERFLHLPYEEKRRMGRAAREKMEREFDRTIVVDKYLDLLRELERKSNELV